MSAIHNQPGAEQRPGTSRGTSAWHSPGRQTGGAAAPDTELRGGVASGPQEDGRRWPAGEMGE